MLIEHLQNPRKNDKKIQTSIEDLSKCHCQCTCKKRRKNTIAKSLTESNIFIDDKNESSLGGVTKNIDKDIKPKNQSISPSNISVLKKLDNIDTCNNISNVTSVPQSLQQNIIEPNTRLSVESQVEDDVMLQLERLFHEESNKPEDDLFEGTLYNDIFTNYDDHKKELHDIVNQGVKINEPQQIIKDDQAAKIKSLDERLALLESSSVLPINNTTTETTKTDSPKRKQYIQNKWLCEMYFQKKLLYEKLDEIRDSNRKKHARVRVTK